MRGLSGRRAINDFDPARSMATAGGDSEATTVTLSPSCDYEPDDLPKYREDPYATVLRWRTTFVVTDLVSADSS
jgi:hypothetical protein